MSKAYNEYLNEHIGAVRKAASWMADNLEIVRDMTDEAKFAFNDLVQRHDTSKWYPPEYKPYDAYFYGEKDEDAFNRAWLHHIHNNPHHWQHWLLVMDEGGTVALEMPKAYALEMVADWWSFSWRSGNLDEVFGWYEDYKDAMILHPKTREFVEAVLGEIREKVANE